MLQRRTLFLAAAVAAAGLAFAPKSQAAPGDFTYTSTIAPTTGTPTNASGPPVSSLTLAPNAAADGTTIFNATGGTDVVTTDLTEAGLTGGVTPSTDVYNQPVTLTISITSGGETKSFTFTGTLNGSITRATGARYSSVFNNPGFTPTPQTQTIGGQLFTVVANPTKDFVAPGAPTGTSGTGAAGHYSLTVTAVGVPEPASMALLGLGSLGAIGLIRRGRKA